MHDRASAPRGTALLGDLPCDVLLIQPPVRDVYLTAKRTLPCGLISIAAALRQDGLRVALLDGLARHKSRPARFPAALADRMRLETAPDRSPFALFNGYRHFGYALATIGEQAALSGAFLVGISSLFSAYEDMALACADAVRARCPEAFIVLGGHHPSVFPDRVLNHPNVDFVLRGDGEISLPRLAQVLRNRESPAAVPGIAFDDGSARRRIRPPAYVADLDQLPPPAVDLVKTSFYARAGKATLTLAASRGCPLACSYCCMGAHSQIPFRRRSVAHVMREIEYVAHRHPIGLIDFEDENLAMERSWFADLLQRITLFFSGCPPELRAMNGLFPPALDQDLIVLMRAAGFRQLNLALASSSPRQSRRFRRPYAVADFDRVLAWAEQQGLTAVGYLIAGAPDQSPRSSLEDLLFMAPRRVLVGLSIYYPAPDSLDFEYCRAADVLPASPLSWRSSAYPIDHSTRRSESETLLRLARILNFMKQCVDLDGRLPSPASPPQHLPCLEGSRYAIGRQLLRWFLADGLVRRVDAGGQTAVCPSDPVLADAFRQGILEAGVRGIHR
jgi:hypothetical protein